MTSSKLCSRLHALAVAAASTLGLTLTAIPAQAQTAHPAGNWVKGRLIVTARAGVPQGELERALGAHGGQARRLGRSDIHVVQLPAGVPEATVVRLLQKHPLLKSAELDVRVPKALQPNDPYAGSQWHLPKLKTGSAWDLVTGSGITIGIVDTGVFAGHADLAANIVPGWNFYGGNSDTSDVEGHGTEVAGTAAAILNNATGGAGVAGGARIMPLRVADSTGWASYSSIADAIVYAADRGVRVVNASFAGLFKSSSVQSAGNYLKSKGGLLVVGAGNAGVDENSPATSSMIVVGATDAADALAGWSSYGAMVSVVAPGVGIYTTSRGGGYISVSGTSYAAPNTAGVVALMMSANPQLSPAQVESLLRSTAVDLGSAGRDSYFGYGLVDAEAAVRAARNTAAGDTQRPTATILSPTVGNSVAGWVAVDVGAIDNVGVTRVDLLVNGALQATDSTAPFQFSWDSTRVANGSATLTAVAYDAAGNSQASAAVTVAVANVAVADTTAPSVTFTSPANGAVVSGNVQVRVASSDDSGASGIRQRLFLNGVQVAAATGASLNYGWNTRKSANGAHTLTAEATDAAGNRTSRSIVVQKTR